MGKRPDMQAEIGAPFTAASTPRGRIAGLTARLRALLADRSDTAVAQKVAGSAFMIRVVNAMIAFASQILLARWMGQTEYGVYVYVWTWVLLLGGTTSLGLASAPQRFIPEYTDSGNASLLRGFLLGSRVLAMITSTLIAGLGVLGIWAFSAWFDSWVLIPLYLAMVCVPMYVLTDVQDGISRTHNWIDVALAPAYFVRPLLILGLLGVMSYAEFAPTATTAMIATVIATWATSMAQLIMLERRLKGRVAPGPRAYETKTWMKVSLPIFMVEGFYLLLAYTDVIVLSAFHPPHDVAVYYAAVKVMSLVAFVSFSVSAAVAHRFTEYAVAGDREKLSAMVRDAARWTFWPSLAGCVILIALGWPILWLFGGDFTSGYPLLFVIAVGLLARAVVGPLERLLNMLGEQNICAAVYGGAFLLNVALCLLLVPSMSAMGAAIATSITLVSESIALFWVTRKRLGLGVLPWGRGPDPATSLNGDAMTDVLTLPMPTAELAPLARAKTATRCEILTIDAMAEHRAAWECLANRALGRNLFAEADFAVAADALDAVRTVKIAAVWDDSAPEPRLLAVAGVAKRRTLLGYASAHWAFFGPLGTPLIDRERADVAIRGLLDGLASHGGRFLMVRFMPLECETADAIRAVVARTGRSMMEIESHGRALLRTGEPAEAYLSASLSPKKLKELRRQFRRLGDDGEPVFREVREPAAVMAALERYLDLEDAGWKGANGTSMRRHDDHLAFIRRLFAGRADKGEARILELYVGERLAASGLVLTSGRQAWFYKIAYDEALARCSPGVQLTLELTKRVIEDPSLDAMDSTAIANHPMIDHVWRERLQVADMMIALRPKGAIPLPLVARAERGRRRLRARLRDLYHRIKERSR